MAAGVSFLLWRDLENRADMVSNDDGESHKGDWFLSLSNFSGRDDDDDSEGDSDSNMEKFASRTRARLYFHLSLFGLLNLGAHGGYILSNQAPFLGASAAIINVHNTLACVSALMKEEGSKDLVSQLAIEIIQEKEGIEEVDAGHLQFGCTCGLVAMCNDDRNHQRWCFVVIRFGECTGGQHSRHRHAREGAFSQSSHCGPPIAVRGNIARRLPVRYRRWRWRRPLSETSILCGAERNNWAGVLGYKRRNAVRLFRIIIIRLR